MSYRHAFTPFLLILFSCLFLKFLYNFSNLYIAYFSFLFFLNYFTIYFCFCSFSFHSYLFLGLLFLPKTSFLFFLFFWNIFSSHSFPFFCLYSFFIFILYYFLTFLYFFSFDNKRIFVCVGVRKKAIFSALILVFLRSSSSGKKLLSSF